MGQLCSTPPKTNIKASVALSQEFKGILFESINGDIIDAEAEAIINAANQQLIHNNGLGNSLLARGGQTIQEESNKIKQEFEAEIPIGQAVITSAGSLKAKYIIHVISPVWNGGSNNEEAKLAECVTNALAQAEKHKLKSIAVPSLDGGVFGFPTEKAAKIIVEQCVQYINANQPTSIQSIKFVNTNAVTVSAFKTAIQNSLLKAGALNGESVQLAREDVVERETTTTTEAEISHQEERVVRSHKPVEHPVEQRPETVETVSEEKKAEVPVPEAAIEQVAEKTVEQAIEQAVEQVIEEKQQEQAPIVVEPVVEEQKPQEVVEQPAAIEEKPVEEQAAAVEEQAAVVEEQAAAVEEQAAAVEEQAAAVEKQAAAAAEKKAAAAAAEKQAAAAAAVEEKQEEAPVAIEQPAEEKLVEEQPAIVEEQKPEEVVEQPAAVEEKQEETPAAVEEKTTEEQPAVVEEQKTEEVAAETKTEETTETQETKETEAEEQGEAAAEEAQNDGEQGGKKKKNKKKGRRN